MEPLSVFVSAVLVCVVTAGIPHDGIHWTYTGVCFLKQFLLNQNKIELLHLICDSSELDLLVAKRAQGRKRNE